MFGILIFCFVYGFDDIRILLLTIMNAYYAGIVLYPETFADVDMATIGGRILETMLGENFFEEMEAGGLYYGKLTLGS